MVAVEMGQKDVQPLPVHADLRQLALHGLPAGRLPETGVDQQTPLACYEVAVQIFQRISHQRDIQPPQIVCNLLRHIRFLSVLERLYQIFRVLSSEQNLAKALCRW